MKPNNLYDNNIIDFHYHKCMSETNGAQGTSCYCLGEITEYTIQCNQTMFCDELSPFDLTRLTSVRKKVIT